jgi:hypothetical protein
MEKRKSERVQFFQVGTGKDIQPVWVFRQIHPEATLGLLLDIGANGAQVLTDKSQNLHDADYRMIIHGADVFSEATLIVNGRCRWSQRQGTLYVRHGLVFDEEASDSELQALQLQKCESGWLRCELLPVSLRA